MTKYKKNKIKIKSVICYTGISAVICGLGVVYLGKQDTNKQQQEVVEFSRTKEDKTKMMTEKLRDNMSHIHLQDDIKYVLQAYYDGENTEYVLQDGVYENETCEGTHQYYYRYVVEEQKFEPVGFTCDGYTHYHQDENDLLMERSQLFGVAITTDAAHIKAGDVNTISKEELEVTRKRLLAKMSFPIVDDNNRALCAVKMTSNHTGEEIYFVGYLRVSNGEMTSFYDVLDMKTKSFPTEAYTPDYYSLLSSNPDESLELESLNYDQVCELEKYMIENQTLTLPVTCKTFQI